MLIPFKQGRLPVQDPIPFIELWEESSGSKIATISVLTSEVVNMRSSVRPTFGILTEHFLFPFVSTVWRARRQSSREFSSCTFLCAHLGARSQKQSSEFSYHQHGKFHLIPRGNTPSEFEVDRDPLLLLGGFRTGAAS